ncbi:aspartate dehydrogenase domain-containing protein [Brevibacterium aurantiacum]|uniref:aspartate dehydrogenase domain-containing protein n=1 Tax=Brevibacterium aurantiacum TaxID=273384 RepID=UPI0013FE2E0D|nr:aspartate dehydrogenase domain-containing protein [Brevibacterium aurantiacum]
MSSQREVTSVLLIGFGAIGRHVARLLHPEISSGRLRLTALVRDLDKHADHQGLGAELIEVESPQDPRWTELRADVVVECAGVPAARAYGPAVIAAGLPFVLTSVGALADRPIRQSLLTGPGELHVTNGAIGGLDVLEAAAQAQGLDEVSIRTAKAPAGLIQPWMDAEEVRRLRSLNPADGPLTIFTGSPAEAIVKFPSNVNITVALAWATRGLGFDAGADDELMERALQRTRVEIRADPSQVDSHHEITASGSAGDFAFSISSTPSPENPATSGLTALSVTRTLRICLADFRRR